MRWLPFILLFAGAVQAAPPVKFSDALYTKFQHPRCLQCHQFNSAAHQGRAYASHANRFLCDRCHTAHVTGLPAGEWIAPPARLDWTHLSASETCELIKRNLPSGDLRLRMQEHLHGDPRVNWALTNGMTPAGRFPAVPGGAAAFAREVDEWIADGMLCE